MINGSGSHEARNGLEDEAYGLDSIFLPYADDEYHVKENC